MFTKKWIQVTTLMLAATGSLFLQQASLLAGEISKGPEANASEESSTRWQTEAKWKQDFIGFKDQGTLSIDDQGVRFESKGGHSQKWSFLDIQSLLVAPHRLELETYARRSMHRPGEQRYEFKFSQSIPAEVAARLANGVKRPSQNAVPNSESSEITSVPVHHKTFRGGTNGILRFRQDGIDYITVSGEDSRSWRWSDLETLSLSDPYHLLVFGYRDTYTFDLKKPLARAVFDQAAKEIASFSEGNH